MPATESEVASRGWIGESIEILAYGPLIGEPGAEIEPPSAERRQSQKLAPIKLTDRPDRRFDHETDPRERHPSDSPDAGLEPA